MFKKTLISTAAAALFGIGAIASAATVITNDPVVDRDGVKEKKVILHENGDRTVVKKKTSVNGYGQTTVHRKVVRHTAGTHSNVMVVHRAPAVVVHRVERPATTTVIRETTN
jgi:hypothetical protein